ncbi:MAG: hypothetical protein AAGC81_10720 [Pseudomonadota bacterium]
MISHFLYACLSSGFAAFIALFLTINAGLRLIPSGRQFLLDARAKGRMTAPYRLSAPLSVHLVFVLAGVVSAITALITWVAIRSGLQ